MLILDYPKSSSRFLKMGIGGSVMAALGILMYTFNPLQAVIKAIAVLAPNSILFNIWTTPPFDVLISAYIFNVTNIEDFLKRGEKLKLVEVGPYVYQEVLTNGNGVFNENGTITFEPRRNLKFRLDKSIGDPKVDKIISVNIPLLGITSSLRDKSFFVNFAVTQIASMLNSSSVLELTVDEYLWGYDDRLVELANKVLPNWIDFSRFGIFERMMALDNASNIVTIKSNSEIISDNNALTKEERSQKYSITRFNGSPGLPLWGYTDDNTGNNTRCNTVEGSYDGSIFPSDLKPNSSIRFYRRAFCRPVMFKYEDIGTYDGFEIYKYRVDKYFLGTKEENPDNACYCFKGKCPKKGVSYLTPCYYGIPVSISQPHFYNADPSLRDAFEGMIPNKELHDSTLKIHPKLGVPLHASLKIQINLDVDTKYSPKCAPFNGLVLPLFWLQLDMTEIPNDIKLLLSLLYHVLPVGQTILTWVFVLFGIAMVAAAALFTFYGPTNHGLEDPYANRIGYSPIRIIPMTNYLNQNLIRK